MKNYVFTYPQGQLGTLDIQVDELQCNAKLDVNLYFVQDLTYYNFLTAWSCFHNILYHTQVHLEQSARTVRAAPNFCVRAYYARRTAHVRN